MTGETPLRTGVLFKKGSGNGPFGRRNWKPRYFVLTPNKLTYYTYEDGELKGEVDLTGCNEQSIEVMPADSMKTGSSASTIWRIAINTSDRRLLVAAGTEMEMNDWVEKLLIAFSVNSGQSPPPLRQSFSAVPVMMPATGAVMHSSMSSDFSRNSITDFQNFATARRAVGGAMRASMGAHPSHEFRLSDEHERARQVEAQRVEEQRQLAETEAERLREEEVLQAHLRSQAEERRKQKEAQEMEQQHSEEEQHLEEERVRLEQLLEEQRRHKREQHERERQEAERLMRELELQEQEKQHEVEVQHHFEEEDHMEVEFQRHQIADPVVSSPVHSPVTVPPSAPSPPPRSSLIGDAKKEAMMRQQAEHNKRRESMIKEQQEQARKEFLAQQELEMRASHTKHEPPAPVSPAHFAPQHDDHHAAPPSPAKPPVQEVEIRREMVKPAGSVEF